MFEHLFPSLVSSLGMIRRCGLVGEGVSLGVRWEGSEVSKDWAIPSVLSLLPA